MQRSEIEQVLANWIGQAISGPGRLAEGVDPANWVATQFLNWWRPQVEDSLGDAERAVAGVRHELNRLGGWENTELAEALHELIHIGDALSDLRNRLGLPCGLPKSSP
jgi:hypothetical protein